MAIFFSLTTPIGITRCTAISSGYSPNSLTALAVEGVFNAASAGILIHMALVDLQAADFMSPRMHSNLRLQLGAYRAIVVRANKMTAGCSAEEVIQRDKEQTSFVITTEGKCFSEWMDVARENEGSMYLRAYPIHKKFDALSSQILESFMNLDSNQNV